MVGKSRLKHAAFALVLAAITSSAWFIRRDAEPPSFDESWYLEMSCRFHRSLTERGPAAFASEYAHSFRFKSPLISVIPMPAYAVFGISEDAAFLANLAALPVTALLLFLLGRLLFSEEIAALALIVWITTPLTFGLSRRFFVENWLTTFTVAAVYYLLRSDSLRRSGDSTKAGIYAGLGLLTKSIFPLYLLGPLYETLRTRMFPPTRKRLADLLHDFRPFLYPLIAISLSWYAFNWMTTAVFMIRGGYGDIGAHYGHGPSWHPDNLFRFAKIILAGCTSYYYAAALAVLGAALMLARRRSDLPAVSEGERASVRLCTLWITVPLAFIMLGAANEIRYFNPCLPAFALLTARALQQTIGRARLRAPLIAAFFLYPAASFWAQTTADAPTALRRLVPSSTLWSGPVLDADRFGQEAFVDSLAAEIGGPAVIALGLEQRYLNANRLAALSACRGHDLSFVNYGHMESRVERIVARLSQKDVDYLLMVDGLETPGLPRGAIAGQKAFSALLVADELPFSLLREFELENGASVRLLKRTGHLKMMGRPGNALPQPGKLK